MERGFGRVIVLLAGAIALSGCGGGGGGDNKGILSFTSLSYSVGENGSPLNDITVQRLGGAGAVSCTVIRENGTATTPADFPDGSIVVSWDAGDVSPKIITIPVVDDHLDEPEEALTLRLVNPTGGATIRDPLGDTTLHIVDNDVGGELQFSMSAYLFGEDGVPLGLEVQVMRVGGMDGPITATIRGFDDTASSDPASQVEPVDYILPRVVVSFADQDSNPVTVFLSGVIRQDVLPEVNEQFFVEIVNPTGGATVGFTSPASITIIDDDLFLEIPNPEVGTAFGASVAKLGPNIVVGAPGNAAPNGRVYVFDPATGMLIDTIARPSSDQLGAALAVDADVLAVGSSAGVWILEVDTLLDRHVLTSPLPGFGTSLAGIGDGRLAVGAPTGAGAVVVYDEISGSLLQTIPGTGSESFGSAFARFGTDLVIGAPGSAGRVLQYGGTPLALGPVIDDPAPQAPATAFGTALATFAAESAIIASAPDADVAGAVDGGAVHLITPSGVTTASLPVAGARFGASLLLIGDFLCIQAPGDGPSGTGRVHVWDRMLTFSINPIDDPSPAPNADFGAAMCEYDGVVLIGAPGQPVGGAPDRGSVFVFRLF